MTLAQVQYSAFSPAFPMIVPLQLQASVSSLRRVAFCAILMYWRLCFICSWLKPFSCEHGILGAFLHWLQLVEFALSLTHLRLPAGTIHTEARSLPRPILGVQKCYLVDILLVERRDRETSKPWRPPHELLLAQPRGLWSASE